MIRNLVAITIKENSNLINLKLNINTSRFFLINHCIKFPNSLLPQRIPIKKSFANDLFKTTAIQLNVHSLMIFPIILVDLIGLPDANTKRCAGTESNRFSHKNFVCREQKIEFIVDNQQFLLNHYSQFQHNHLGEEFQFFIQRVLPKLNAALQHSEVQLVNRSNNQCYTQSQMQNQFNEQNIVHFNAQQSFQTHQQQQQQKQQPIQSQQNSSAFQTYSQSLSNAQQPMNSQQSMNSQQPMNSQQSMNAKQSMNAQTDQMKNIISPNQTQSQKTEGKPNEILDFLKQNIQDPKIHDLMQKLKQHSSTNTKQNYIQQQQITMNEKIDQLGLITDTNQYDQNQINHDQQQIKHDPRLPNKHF